MKQINIRNRTFFAVQGKTGLVLQSKDLNGRNIFHYPTNLLIFELIL